MLVELRHKSQITIPKDIITKLGLNEGDKFEVVERDGTINLVPVVIYPKKYIDELQNEVNTIKEKIASGEHPVFTSVDALFDKLEAD